MTTKQSHVLHVGDAEVQFYRDHGYFIYQHPLFPQEKFQRLQHFFEDMLAELPEGKRPEAMDVPHFAHRELFEWLFADEVLDFVEAFIGPDIVLWSSHFISKPPGDGKRVPWHEDSAYWAPRLDRHEVLTVWLAIDDSTRENGCMRVVSDTHGHGFSDYEPVDAESHVFGLEIVPEQVDQARIVDLELCAGQCHIHHSKTIHGSDPNASDRRRCGYTMRYMPASVKVLSDGPHAKHEVYLARGQDRAGNEYGDPMAPYVPVVG